MASLFYSPREDRWRVVVTENRKQRSKSFLTEADGLAYMDLHGLKREKRGGHRRRREDVARIISEGSETSDNGCRLWTGLLTNAGYGRLTWKQPDGTIIRGAHRIAYFLAHGEIPAGMVLDHLCRTRHCVNADHLEVVTSRENIMRSPIAMGALNATKTHCPKGHPYDEENTYVYTFKTKKTTNRICKTCSRAHHRRYRERKAVSA